jgi:hypothetical protein
MGRGSAQVLKNSQYQVISRIADRLDIRYDSVIEVAGGGAVKGGRI